MVESGATAPTRQEYERFTELDKQAEAQLARWRTIQAGELAAFNQLVEKQNVPAVVLSGAK